MGIYKPAKFRGKYSGDQGQHYMSDTYLNNAILSGFSLMATK